MSFTLLDLKRKVRGDIWPQGEARSQRPSHDQSIIDALVDLATNVECLQLDQTKIVDQCATLYKCGLTVFDTPVSFIGHINRLSVVVRLDEDKNEDAESPIEWCTEIPYVQVDACYVKAWLARHNKKGCCGSLADFFAIPTRLCGGKHVVPEATDEGVPAGLPSLPLGHHYPQASTDAAHRARYGVWAVERNQIFVAPWIQQAETIIIRWDGVKTEWNDGDLVQNNPKLIQAVKYYVEKEHAKRFGRTADDQAIADRAERDYNLKRAEMMKDCRDQFLVRGCETSKARGSTVAITLFYNDQQSFTASCPPNKTGDQKTVTIPQDTFASAISKADANQKAYNAAREQAEALLDCADVPTTYWNTPQSYTARCEQADEDAPVPEGSPVTITIPANTYSSTVSQAAADALALAAATEQANDGLTCTFWNRQQSYTASCPEGETGDPVTKTIAEHTYSSTISQAAADAQALQEATAQAIADLSCSGPQPFGNDEQVNLSASQNCIDPVSGLICVHTVHVTVLANRFFSFASISEANQQAINFGVNLAQQTAQQKCQQLGCPSGSVFDYYITY